VVERDHQQLLQLVVGRELGRDALQVVQDAAEVTPPGQQREQAHREPFAPLLQRPDQRDQHRRGHIGQRLRPTPQPQGLPEQLGLVPGTVLVVGGGDQLLEGEQVEVVVAGAQLVPEARVGDEVLGVPDRPQQGPQRRHRLVQLGLRDIGRAPAHPQQVAVRQPLVRLDQQRGEHVELPSGRQPQRLPAAWVSYLQLTQDPVDHVVDLRPSHRVDPPLSDRRRRGQLPPAPNGLPRTPGSHSEALR
jgi:hypothetical protein